MKLGLFVMAVIAALAIWWLPRHIQQIGRDDVPQTPFPSISSTMHPRHN